jgi:hypothetical protein
MVSSAPHQLMIVSPIEQGMNTPSQMRIPSYLPRFKWTNEKINPSQMKEKEGYGCKK